ncbi:MAG TPA: arginine--tRNA ligase, partial [Gaiellales bacterium]|nr:arginine--tRNA ligase [Gaiellales bacterium]
MTTPERPGAREEVKAMLAGVLTEIGAGGTELRLDHPADPAHGDLASAVAMGLARTLKQPPRAIAERIAERISSPLVEQVTVAGPGFVNLRLSPAWYRLAVERALDAGARYGAGARSGRRVQIEYVSANPVGPLTVGSARNAAYGDALARLLAFAGDEVSREYYFNDAGRQIDLFGASLRARARGEDPPEDGYQGAYVAELAGDLALSPDASAADWARAGVEAMMGRIRRVLGTFRVAFDSWFLERSLHDDGSVERAIDAVRRGGHAYQHDGALWLRTTDFGDDKDRVVMRSDGRPTYFAGDIAYVASKLERGFDTAIYVLGADHHGYVGRLKGAAAALGYDPARVDVQIYQLVHLAGGRMSKRAGRIVTLEDLIEAIGVDAARFALVQRSHDQTVELDLDLLTAQNAENPVYYCQYAHARIAAILRNAPTSATARPAPSWLPEPAERALVLALADFPDLVSDAVARRAPHRFAVYAQDTARLFHQFYNRCR